MNILRNFYKNNNKKHQTELGDGAGTLHRLEKAMLHMRGSQGSDPSTYGPEDSGE